MQYNTLKPYAECKKDIDETLESFILQFLHDNRDRCLDDSKNQTLIANYLRNKMPECATELCRAALGLVK